MVLERRDDAHPPQPVLDVRERLIVVEVVAGDQAVDRIARDAELAVAELLDRERPARRRTEDPEGRDLQIEASDPGMIAAPAGQSALR